MTNATDMTRGNPARLMISFALPLMAGSMLQQAYTLTDTAIVGQFIGVEALAALGAADWFNWMVLSLLMGFTQGFSILMSHRFGAGNADGLRKAFAMSVCLSVGVAVATLILSQALAGTVLRLLNTPDNVYDNALLYVRVYFCGVPTVTGYNLLAGALRALGDSKTPLKAMAISASANVALDLLFVVGFHWGIAGAAAATLLAQALSMLYCLRAALRAPQLRLRREDWRADGRLCARLMRLGAPVALQNAVISVGGMAVQRIVNSFGFLFIAGYTATNKLYGLLELAAISFGHALSVYTGQNMGAGRADRIRKGTRAAAGLCVAISACICGLMLLFGKNILGLFLSADPAAREVVMGYAFEFLKLMSLCLPILYLLYVYRSALQGMGDTVTPMLSGFVELAMRVGAAALLSRLIGYYGTFVAEVAAWTGAAVLQAVAYYARIRRLERGK